VSTSALAAARLILARDLRLALRKRGQFVQPLAFFAIVTTLFPLSISPELARLREIASGVLWVAALLASLLATTPTMARSSNLRSPANPSPGLCSPRRPLIGY